MSTIIIVIAIIAIIGLLILRSKQNKAPETKKASTASAKKAPAKKGKSTEEKPVETKPKVDITNLLSQIDVLIADREYAKAEGIINQALNKDANLHTLYHKLLTLYQLQDDDFAIKQLLETVQNLNLNEVYQQLYNEQEAFKAEQERRKQLEPKKTPDVFEFTPGALSSITETETQAKPETPHQQQNNTLAFDQLSFDAPTTKSEPTISEAPTQQAQVDNTLEFSSSPKVQAQPEPIVHDVPTFEFKLEETTPVEPTPTIEPLEFKLDQTPSVENHQAPTLDFNFSNDAAKTEQPTQTFSFDLETPIVAETSALQLETPSELEIVSNEIEFESTDTFADATDPLAQTFPALQNTDPTELDIELAEQYIRFGEYQAAKSLLNVVESTPLAEHQATKVSQLLQKIAS